MNAPLYEQIEDDLARQIFEGHLPPGAALKTEDDLCELYNVSRITVRRAVDELVRKRLLERRRGVGTFILDPKEQLKAVTLTGYIEDVLPTSRFKLVKADRAALPESVQDVIPSRYNKPSARFVSINHLDGKPFSYGRFFFFEDVSHLISEADFQRAEPPIRLIESRSSQRVVRAVQHIHPDIASLEVARHLGIRPKTPLLRIVRVYFAVGNVPLECVEAHYHPERYQFSVELLPRSAPQTRVAKPSRSLVQKQSKQSK
jgi:GntR family transcriptional regulator